MGPQRTHPRARAHVRSRYLKGVAPLLGGEIEGAAEVTVSKKAGAADRRRSDTASPRERRARRAAALSASPPQRTARRAFHRSHASRGNARVDASRPEETVSDGKAS